MTPNVISNLIFVGLSIGGTILRHYFPEIPQDLLLILYGLAGYNGIKTATTSQIAHDAKPAFTVVAPEPTPSSIPVSAPANVNEPPSKAGTPQTPASLT